MYWRTYRQNLQYFTENIGILALNSKKNWFKNKLENKKARLWNGILKTDKICIWIEKPPCINYKLDYFIVNLWWNSEVYVDFCKASDSLNHVTLCEKLKKYGIGSVALKLVRNYLEKRTQQVVENNE